MTALTLALAEFVPSVDASAIPERSRHAACVGITDCVGVMIAGAREPAVRLIAAMTPTSTSNDGAPEIISGRNLSAADAALVNGMAAHALDYDDVSMDGHTSAVLTPAILAEGWSLGVSGREALAAYTAGYEVWALLQEIEPGQMHNRGFHPTAIWGTLSVAAACARLHRLPPDQTQHALAIAASMASGLVSNFGTMTKILHVGRSAQAGVMAARLAKSGFTGAVDALEHPAGFMHAHSPSGQPDIAPRDWRLGQEWRLPRNGINVKRYPICYATHRSIDAMLDLVTQHDLDPAAIAEIHVRIGRTQKGMLRNSDPKTALEAKFSIEFALAAAIVARQVGLSELDDAFVRRSDVVETMGKVRCTTTDELRPNSPFAPEDRVGVVLASGERIDHAPVAHPKGSWEDPMNRDEMRAKFLDCARGALGAKQAVALFDALERFDSLPSLRELPLIAVN